VDMVVKGRNVEVPDHFREHVIEKLQKVERYDQKLIRVDVELSHERNRRQQEHCQRVEITCVSRGPAVRAEACAKDFYSALDQAIAKIESRLSRMADRRRVHRGRRTPVSVASATAPLAEVDGAAPGVALLENDFDGQFAERLDEDGPGHIVREKEHPGDPITIDDALFQMELVGHDFYLFQDKESGRPSVVYRRKGYDYGIIRLTD
jgi:ribosomal subunit interface protein